MRRPVSTIMNHKRAAAPAALLIAIFALPGCPRPGWGAKAQRGYQRADPVVAALEQYRGDHAGYPGKLSDLIPTYLSPAALQPPDAPQELWPFTYARVDEEYELSFHYAGPGMNTCTYRPSTGWKCHGAF